MSEYKVEKSLSADRLLSRETYKRDWATIEEEDRAYNLSLGDAIVELPLSSNTLFGK